MKDQIEELIDFEGTALKEKYYVITAYGSLDSKILKEIEDIKSRNDGYRFVVVSSWAVGGKFEAVPYDNITLNDLPDSVDEEQPPKPAKKEKAKKGKGKKGKKAVD